MAKATKPLLSEFQWLTTAPNPNSRPGTPSWNDYDQGQRGWRLHAVRASTTETFPQVSGRQALCGLRPAHGWDLDLFIDPDAKCLRCKKALGLPETYEERHRRLTRKQLREGKTLIRVFADDAG